MSYLRVECWICKKAWNFYIYTDRKVVQEEKVSYPPILSTAVQYQGCVCPQCGNIGFIPSKSTKDTNEVSV